MAEKKTGRPPKYTEEQVIEGIKIIEKGGEHPSGENVKKALVAQLGVPDTINAQCLDKEVQRLVAELKHQHEERLVAELPEATRQKARQVAATVEAQMLVHMGEQHRHLRTLNASKVVAKDTDLANQRAQIRDLLTKQDRLITEIEDIGRANEEKSEMLSQAMSENSTLQARIAELEKEQDFRAQMLAMVKETLAQQPSAAE